MNRFMLRLLRDLYPEEFPRQEASPEHRQRGRDLARFKPWARGRIGAVERRVHSALIQAEHQKVYPVTTGWVARQVYLGVAGRAAELPKLKRWMYGTIRKALETYAVRVGRGNGHGSPILWRLKPGDAVYASVIRKKKALAYAKHKRKRAEQA